MFLRFCLTAGGCFRQPKVAGNPFNGRSIGKGYFELVKNRLNLETILTVHATGDLLCAGKRYRCALGRGGVGNKAGEGDGVTPVGIFPLRRLFYRGDRLDEPATGLPCLALRPDHGWCDAPEDPHYNRLVQRPFAASHEHMWRDDALYDLVVELGYNDDPVLPGRGSAIFMHVARPDYADTEGCVALARPDLLEVLERCGPATRISITT